MGSGPEALGLGQAVGRRLWNDSLERREVCRIQWARGSPPFWRAKLHEQLYSLFLEQDSMYGASLELDASMSAASVPLRRLFALGPVSRSPSKWTTRSLSNFSFHCFLFCSAILELLFGYKSLFLGL